MDSQIKDKWVAALRSSHYTQGCGCLRSKKNTYCCLGVLCDVIDPSVWDDIEIDLAGYYLYDGAGGILPVKLREDINLSLSHENHLISMNDCGETFEEIAKYIETAVAVEGAGG